MKTDKEKFIELMESFGLKPESIFDMVNKNNIESLMKNWGLYLLYSIKMKNSHIFIRKISNYGI